MYEEYEYLCSARQPNDKNNTPCGKAIHIGYNKFLCGNKKGMYAPDYSKEKCGYAKKRIIQMSLFDERKD